MKKQSQLGIIEAFEGKRNKAGSSLTSSVGKYTGKPASKRRSTSSSGKVSGTTRQTTTRTERRLFALTDVTNATRSKKNQDGRQTGKVVDTQASLEGRKHVKKEPKHEAIAEVSTDAELEVNEIDLVFKNTPAAVQLVPDYAKDNAEFMFEKEDSFAPDPSYMELQDELQYINRAVVVDWLVEIASELHVSTETLYLAVSYMDRYLSAAAVRQQDLQLLGVTCFHIASKYEDLYPPSSFKLADFTDGMCSSDEILNAEGTILDALKFRLSAPTPKSFLQRFVRAVHLVSHVEIQLLELVARYVLELSLLDYGVLKYKASTRAAAALFLARYYLTRVTIRRIASKEVVRHVIWTKTLEVHSKHTAKELQSTAMRMHKFVINAATLSQRAILDKYSDPRFMRVARNMYPQSIQPQLFEQYYSVEVPVDWMSPHV